jgi:uncharacterized protein
MDAHGFDPRKLDMAAFAAAGAELHGEWPLAGFGRLLQDALPDAAGGVPAPVTWSARGVSRSDASGVTRTRLHLTAAATLRLACQRCLQPLQVDVEARSVLRFVEGEDEAERLDTDSDEDVLALTHSLDLHELVEDELILALPLVPRHDRCPVPLPAGAAEAEAQPRHPFAALAVLRQPPGKA